MLEQLLVSFLNTLHRRPDRPTIGPGLVLGHASETHTRVILPHVQRFEHAVILGKTGVGKTHVLESVACQHFERGEGFCFFDFHGDATEHLVSLAAQFPQSLDRLVLFDPTHPHLSPGLNPLEMDARREHEAFSRTAELTSILKQRWGVDSFGARTEELMRHVFYTLAVNGYTLIEASALLTSRAFRQRLIANVRNPEVTSYWLERYEPLSDAMKSVFREPLLNKVSGFVTDPLSRHLLGQTHSTLDFADAMANGRWVLINLSKGQLRDHAHTLGNLIFARLQFDVMARASLPERQRPLFSILCDEVQNIAENDLVTLLTEGRKYGVSLFTANQFWEQLPRALRGALLSAGTHIFFRLSAHDAATLVKELSSGGQRYQQQITTLERGEAIIRVGSNPAHLVRTPRLPARKTAVPLDEMRSVATQRSARSRHVIEQEIRSRREPVTPPMTPMTHHDTTDHAGEGQASW